MKKMCFLALLFVIGTTCGCTASSRESEQIQESWEEAYREILLNIGAHLADPLELRTEPEYYIYLLLHDFNDDGTPELVIGDPVSAAVYTYENNSAKRITDLCEPEVWGGINGMYLEDNQLIIGSNGSDGSCYVGFTYDYIYDRGRYVLGVYDEYLPEYSIMNGSVSAAEEFLEQFPFYMNREHSVERTKKDGDIIFLEADGDGISIKELDFDLIKR